MIHMIPRTVVEEGCDVEQPTPECRICMFVSHAIPLPQYEQSSVCIAGD